MRFTLRFPIPDLWDPTTVPCPPLINSAGRRIGDPVGPATVTGNEVEATYEVFDPEAIAGLSARQIGPWLTAMRPTSCTRKASDA